MHELTQKCEKMQFYAKLYILTLLIAFKMTYSCCFSFGGNPDSPDFLQKKFYNMDYRKAILTLLKETSPFFCLEFCCTVKWHFTDKENLDSEVTQILKH